MDIKLKEAMTAVRSGDSEAAQQQLASLLAENPEQAQGWYLLSLLVDSPQKQAAFLSKTLALDPKHAKAKEHLATLQMAAGIDIPSPTAPASSKDTPESLPDAMPAEGAQIPQSESTTTPDWLNELDAAPVSTDPLPLPIEDAPTVLGQKALAGEPKNEAASGQTKPPPKSAIKQQTRPKATRGQNTLALNLILGLLVTVALVVIIILAYLILN